jgi:adenine-specific DNA-methyltransferase
MPSAEQLRNRLLKKLSELFQLDQPDLDFGFYRVMHAKAREVQDFINNDLLKIVEDAFGQVDEARKAELLAAYEKAIQTAREFGAENPEETEPVKKARAALDAVKDTASAEADVYDHLYRFFERYYDDGDFISRRYYTRETSGKAAPYAIPYNGEEVKLHWANADQYYIKTTEYFSNFTFDLRQAKEIRALAGSLGLEQDETPLKVHFRIVDATEGEHGNVKPSEANRRYFIIHKDKPIEMNDAGELVVNFEYRPDPEKSGQEKTWREKRNAEAVEVILNQLECASKSDDEQGKRLAEYLRLFNVPAPTEKNKKRPLLAKYINQYTARNTMDYFIHKDLGGFLRRELDFYIKNEVMRLDDIENADAPAVESYLAKIKVLRKIANKIIDFLAQLEDFQKKLWLKKKFVVETNYCITLDRVPEDMYPEIAANDAQREEWVKLFAIDEIEGDSSTPGYSNPLTVDFLKANDKLVLDTRFFDDEFKARLIASIEDFDEQCDGLLIHSENFQALNLLRRLYQNHVECIYIDPPYNTGDDQFIFKDSFSHSSWMSMFFDRVSVAKKLLKKEGVISYSIGEKDERHREMHKSIFLADIIFGESNWVNHFSIETANQSENKFAIRNKEHLVVYAKDREVCSINYPTKEQEARCTTSNANQTQPVIRFPAGLRVEGLDDGEYTPDFFNGWGNSYEKIEFIGNSRLIVKSGRLAEPLNLKARWSNPNDLKNYFLGKNSINKFGKKLIDVYLKVSPRRHTFKVMAKKQGFDTPASILRFTSSGGGSVFRLFGKDEKIKLLVERLRPKPVNLCAWVIRPWQETVLDFFAGAGTTGHSVIDMNREDGGRRKYILVEMGDYFDTVLKPRIAKVVYSESWKNGKPTARDTGISHCFKYLRLESYEDTLNNLRFDENPVRKQAVAANASLKEDYMLRYLLEVETRSSQSLLNIDAFADPTAYTLKVKKPGTDEYVTRVVDLIETFNYLIGLRVIHYAAPQTFTAQFKRVKDPEVPKDQKTRLVVDGKIRQDADGPWWFRKVEGWVPKDPANPNNGQREKVLIVWRKLTGNLEKDNLMLDEWFQRNRISTRDFEFDTIYVNGSNNLPNLKLDEESWKVRLIEEEFMKRMWDAQDV